MAANDKPYFERLVDFLDEHKETRGAELLVTGTSALLFGYAYFRVRPISKFSKPSHIPRHFIREKIIQRGRVTRLEPSLSDGAVLLVDHKPPVSILSAAPLPVKISGISVNANGFSWLQTVLTNQEIEFLPVKRNRTNAECRVDLIKWSGKDQKYKQTFDVAEQLLKLGFAKIETIPEVPKEDKSLFGYFKRLIETEKGAKSRRKGMWYQNLPPLPLPIRALYWSQDKAVEAITPEKYRLPELVR